MIQSQIIRQHSGERLKVSKCEDGTIIISMNKGQTIEVEKQDLKWLYHAIGYDGGSDSELLS